MKRLFLILAAFILSVSIYAKPAESVILKDVKSILTKAYNLKSGRIMHDKVTGISYVTIEGTQIWGRSCEYAMFDISIVMDNYANILPTTSWQVSHETDSIIREYICMIDDTHNYAVMMTYYISSNILFIMVYQED